MRALLLFLIGLAFGSAGGFLAAGGMGEGHAHDHAGHGDNGHDHSALIVWDGTPPSISMTMTREGDAVNLHMTTSGFVFTPQDVNGDPVQGTGHTHIYVDGAKVARAYGPDMFLEDVPKGALVRVTFNANNHAGWVHNETPIAIEMTAP